MKYFIIRGSSDPKITGLRSHPVQGEIIREGYTNKNNYDIYYEYFYGIDESKHFGTFPEFEVNLEYIKIKKAAKILDFMRFSPVLFFGNFLVSIKAQEVLKKYNLPPYKFLAATLYHKDEILSGYRVLYCPYLANSVIDFQKTTFYKGFTGDKKKTLVFQNEEEYQIKKTQEIVSVEKIALNSSFDDSLDLLKFRLCSDYFVSERLKNAITEAGLTGLNIIEAKDPEIICNP